jgi:hypothetical protein
MKIYIKMELYTVQSMMGGEEGKREDVEIRRK